MTFDDYLYEGGSVLKNKLGIRNPFDLDDEVNRFAALGMEDLKSEPMPKQFDGAYLRHVHGVLFGDMYDWSGQYRECPMGRNMDFCPPEQISDKVDEFMAGFQKDFMESGAGLSELSDVLADSWGRLNGIHPFRDGNGRSQSMFFFRACEAKGIELMFSDRDIRNLRTARDEASAGRPRLLSNLLSRSMSGDPVAVRAVQPEAKKQSTRRPFERMMAMLAGRNGKADGKGHGGLGS